VGDPLARLSLCLTGDYSMLEHVLADVETMTAERKTLLHDLAIASLTGWSAHQIAAAKQRLIRYNSHLELVPQLLARLPDTEARRIAAFLKEHPGSEVANVLFIQSHTILNAANFTAFLPLIDGSDLELAEQLARSIHRLLPDQRAVLATRLDGLDAGRVSGRVLRIRLADLEREDARRERLRKALEDADEWVMIEALDRLSPEDVVALRPVLAVASASWRDNPYIRHRLALIGVATE